ncbi:MAG TPA: glutamate--cysteine ligase [Pseudonocardia sp.]|nr:glutamate--cysteine ligase [Pseudonocardia sp.]
MQRAQSGRIVSEPGRTVGVEEEFLLVDPADGAPRAKAAALLRTAEDPDTVEGELQLQQVETGTQPCRTLGELHREVRSTRRQASEAARAIGVEIAAVGTSPLPVRAELTPSPRYQEMARRFGLTAQEELTCGCHVHVGVDSDEEGVAVLDRIRPWLPALLAMTANSPFWQGEDSGYASYRSQVWSRWPSTGVNELFGTADVYHDTVRSMIDSGTVVDSGMIYFDGRLSEHYPTVEIRVADVCLRAGDAVLLAALVRGLVETAAREWRAGVEPAPVRVELLRLAGWRAGRSGLEGELLDPVTLRPAPAEAVMEQLLEHVRPALEDTGDQQDVREMASELLTRGTGAREQRSSHKRAGGLESVVTDAVRATLD